MAFRIDPTLPVDAEVRRVAGELVAEAEGHLRVTPVPSVDDIHDARTALKRLRSLLRLVRGELGDERWRSLNDAVRDVGRAVSGVRDADVATETFEALLPAVADLDPEVVARVRAALASDRAAARVEAAAPGTRTPADAADELSTTFVEAELWAVGDRGFATLAPGFGRSYRNGRRALRALGPEPTAEHLHELRKRVKDHWYHLRLLRELWPPVTKAYARQAGDLADELGLDHDLWTLRTVLVERHPTLLGDRGEAVLDALDHERHHRQHRARRLAARIYHDPAPDMTRRFAALWDLAG